MTLRTDFDQGKRNEDGSFVQGIQYLYGYFGPGDAEFRGFGDRLLY